MSGNSPHVVPASADELQGMWKHIACQYFRDRLPPISIEWSFRLTASTGIFVSQVGPRSQRLSKEERHGAARRIRLSAPLLRGQSESEILGTLAHEMIHQWQYDVKKRFPDHGQDFHEVMARMNRDGMGISVRHSLNQRVEQLSKYMWKCRACGNSYRRQRRTISSRRHRCGNCHGQLEEVLLEIPAWRESDLSINHFSAHQQIRPVIEEWNPTQLVLSF